jgi:HSP20 family molecular chaperone IbpA
MARGGIAVKRAETIVEELNRVHHAISLRAFDLFRAGGTVWGDALTDWLTAERELVFKPAIELCQKDSQFTVVAALPGIETKDLEVQITPQDMLIQAATTHQHTSDAGTVHLCEFGGGRIFRSIHFPEKIDPDSARATYRNGVLRLTASIATAAARTVDVKPASRIGRRGPEPPRDTPRSPATENPDVQ